MTGKSRLLLSLGACVAALACVELLARVLMGGGSLEERRKFVSREGAVAEGLVERGHFERTLAVHPYFGYVGRGGKLAVNRFGFFSSKEFSLCGSRLCLSGASGKTLVVGIFGGSLALQLGSMESELENRLAPLFPGREVKVVNFAQPGHAEPQPLHIYSYFRDAVHVAVFLDGLNEIWNPVDNNRLGYPPVYAKATHFQFLDGRRATGRADTLRNRLREAAERSLLPFWNRFALAELLWRFERSGLVRELAKEGAASASAPSFFPAAQAQLVALGVREWAFAHAQAQAIARLSGARFVHLLQPTLLAGSKPRTESERKAAEAQPALGALVKLGYHLLGEQARRLRVTDLTSLFDGTEEPVWLDPAHLNPVGLEQLRTEVVKALAAKR